MSNELLLGIVIGMVLMQMLDHFVFPVIVHRLRPDRRRMVRPVLVERRRRGK